MHLVDVAEFCPSTSTMARSKLSAGQVATSVAVPVIIPAELKESPVGNEPAAREYVYGERPPVDDKV